VVLKTFARHFTVDFVDSVTARTSRNPGTDNAAPDDYRAAARFFWTVLVLATAASIGGNVTHAVLKAGSGSLVMVAAAVAMVPPIVLLAATHSVGLLVRTRSSGPIYWAALAITVGLSGCAFALSFDALWELAVKAGVSAGIAWLWPLSVDVSIAQATIALLSLTRLRNAHNGSAATDLGRIAVPAAPLVASPARRPDLDETPAPLAVPARTVEEVPSILTHRRRDNPGVRPFAPLSSATDWSDVAATLVRDGVTAKSPAEVAAVLALWEADTAPNTIAKRLGVHRDTVTRITGAAEDLLSAAKIRA
jgi:hypothetical protein